VFLFKYGTKIFQKVQEAMQPQFKDEEAINPFDFWKGANFKLKIRKVAGYTNYDKSEFDGASELYKGDDEKLEKLWKTLYKLQDFVAPGEFRSYDELKKKLNDVLGGDIRSVAPAAKRAEDEDDVEAAPARKAPKPDEDEDALEYFKRLAKED
jgi:O6-methylguanine-DNA--protein-cysteine methyltransferase